MSIRPAVLHARWAVAVTAMAVMLPVAAVDPERGRSLYETRCNVCHATGVHVRQSRKAATFEGLREQVVRWSRELGGAWGMDEIDDVTAFLNDRYYFFPCPQTVCRVGQAKAG